LGGGICGGEQPSASGFELSKAIDAAAIEDPSPAETLPLRRQRSGASPARTGKHYEALCWPSRNGRLYHDKDETQRQRPPTSLERRTDRAAKPGPPDSEITAPRRELLKLK